MIWYEDFVITKVERYEETITFGNLFLHISIYILYMFEMFLE